MQRNNPWQTRGGGHPGRPNPRGRGGRGGGGGGRGGSPHGGFNQAMTGPTALQVYANYFAINIHQDVQKLYLYTVRIKQSTGLSRRFTRQAIICLLQQHPAPVPCATDYHNLLVTVRPLDMAYLQPIHTINYEDEDGPKLSGNGRQQRNTTVDFMIEFRKELDIRGFLQYLANPATGYPDKDEMLLALNIIFSHRPNMHSIRAINDRRLEPTIASVGAHKFFSLRQPASCLGRGLEARSGFFRSVRCSSSQKILININRVATAFYKPINLSDLIAEFSGDRNRGEASLRDIDTFISGLRVRTTYFGKSRNRNRERIYKIDGLAQTNPIPTPDNVQIRIEKDGQLRVMRILDYFADPAVHGIRLDQEKYIVKCGGGSRRNETAGESGPRRREPIKIPAEYCEVLPGQSFRRLLADTQIAEMIKFANKSPKFNKDQILSSGRELFGVAPVDGRNGPGPNFGMSWSNEMLTVDARLLQSPVISYSNCSVPQGDTRYGTWNLMDKNRGMKRQFMRPAQVNSEWSILCLTTPRGAAVGPNDLRSFFGNLDREFNAYGIKNCRVYRSEANNFRDHRLELVPGNDRQADTENEARISRKMRDMQRQRRDLKLLFVLLPKKDASFYSIVKRVGDVSLGILTICCVCGYRKNDQKYWGPRDDPATLGNYLLKVNIKLGGTNHTLADDNNIIDANTMIMGMDVTHPGTSALFGAPSIAAVVATNEGSLRGQWPASIRAQHGERESLEMIDALQEMVLERLRGWKMKNNNNLPTRILIYRDGVSEGQFDKVRDEELPKIRQALEVEYTGRTKPSILLLCAIKRHQTRFYPIDPNNSSTCNSRTGNINPGLIVSKGITYETGDDWFGQSHAALQGTAVPTHYKVVVNELPGVSIESIQELTNAMCYTFQRATKAVSIHPAAYYADLACDRVRVWMRRAFVKYTASDEPLTYDSRIWNSWLQPHPSLKESTFYI